MPTQTLSDAAANYVLNALLDKFKAGSTVSAPYIRFYTATKPDKPDTAITTQTLLGTLTCTPSVGSVASRSLTFDAITPDTSADNNGTAAWVRVFDRNNVAVADYDVSNLTGSGFVKMNTMAIVAGGPILINSFVITL